MIENRGGLLIAILRMVLRGWLDRSGWRPFSRGGLSAVGLM